jgi:hypothetical protein
MKKFWVVVPIVLFVVMVFQTTVIVEWVDGDPLPVVCADGGAIASCLFQLNGQFLAEFWDLFWTEVVNLPIAINIVFAVLLLVLFVSVASLGCIYGLYQIKKILFYLSVGFNAIAEEIRFKGELGPIFGALKSKSVEVTCIEFGVFGCRVTVTLPDGRSWVVEGGYSQISQRLGDFLSGYTWGEASRPVDAGQLTPTIPIPAWGRSGLRGWVWMKLYKFLFGGAK